VEKDLEDKSGPVEDVVVAIVVATELRSEHLNGGEGWILDMALLSWRFAFGVLDSVILYSKVPPHFNYRIPNQLCAVAV